MRAPGAASPVVTIAARRHTSSEFPAIRVSLDLEAEALERDAGEPADEQVVLDRKIEGQQVAALGARRGSATAGVHRPEPGRGVPEVAPHASDAVVPTSTF